MAPSIAITPPSDCKVSSSSSSSLTMTVNSPRSLFSEFARSSILSFLQRGLLKGDLRVEDSDGVYNYGSKSSSVSSVHIRVISPHFWTRVFLSGDLGFSEAYMVGEIEVDNLKGVMNIWLDNQTTFTGLSSKFARIVSILSGLSNALLGQTHSQARLNVIASYDQSNELFKAFLSKEMMYSCALWGDEEGGIDGDLLSGPTPNDLETAQLRKIHHVLNKARVRPGHRILEFGSGWGGLAIEAARTYGCSVDSFTLSIEQKTLAEQRVKAAGLDHLVRIHLMDYRDIPSHFEHAFDAFVSIEMLEHVGSHYYKQYFKLVDYALKANNATVVVSASTFPECRYTGYQAQDFMRKYMWPNSCLPSATALISAANAGSQGRFTLQRVENHAAHYPRTLRTWSRRLQNNLKQEIIAQAHPSLQDASEYAIFKRKWEYFFAYAGEGFVRGYITCHMLTFSRANDVPVSSE